MEAVRNAVKKALTSSLKTVTKTKQKPGAYITFAKEMRAELAVTDTAFNAMAANAKMTHIGSLWNKLDESAKADWKAKAEAAFAGPKETTTVMAGSYTDAQLDKLVAQVADEAVKSMLFDLTEKAYGGESEVTKVSKVGSLAAALGEPKRKGAKEPVMITFTPSQAVRAMATDGKL